MPNKFDTVEDLEKFASKLRDTRKKLVKAIEMAEAPENELVKFNDHGQWSLTKSESTNLVAD
jgi:hypothetical protein